MKTFNFYKIIISSAIVIFIITAIQSHGYFHADEHYQIVEYAGVKLGTHSTNELAWEYGAKIRPMLQPTICYALLSSIGNIGINNPYTQLFIIRLLTAILALFTIHVFIQQTQHLFEKTAVKRAYYVLSYFLWIVPLVSVRFSSETLSALFFMLGLTLYLNPKKHQYTFLWMGILLGVSFLFRYQMAFAMTGLGMWILIFDKEFRNKIWLLILGFIVLFGIGTSIDSWFYGELTIAPWNYFYENIIEDVASGFGTSPWTEYFSMIYHQLNPVVGGTILLSLIFLMVFHHKSIYFWIIFPFLFIHIIIPHKENRFLFPLLYIAPFVITLALQQVHKWFGENKLFKIIQYVYMAVFMGINSVGLVAMMQKSAAEGRMTITKYIYDHYPKNQKIHLISSPYANPYNPWKSVPKKFYVESHITSFYLDNIDQLSDSLIQSNYENLLVIRKADLDRVENKKIIQKQNFEKITQSIPQWIERLMENNNEVLILYKQKK